MRSRTGCAPNRRELLTAAAGMGMLTAAQGWAAPMSGNLAETFIHPPLDARPMVRWWWFGPNVRDDELLREIRAMKAGGFGGFEIQPVYPLTVDGNVPYLSDSFLEALALANRTGRAEGLRVDLTLGSGWPFGGPHITPDLASARVRLIRLPLKSGEGRVGLPAFQPGERIVAAYVGKDVETAQRIPTDPSGMQATIETPPAPTPRTVFVVIRSPTGQMVKRPAVGAEGYVMDHMSSTAVQTHLQAVGEPLLRAFDRAPPHAIFSDSLECYGVDWTDDLPAEFRKRRGYDLMPHMLSWFEATPDSPGLRRDWALTLSELTEERYLTPIDGWARQRGTQFRSQTYGHPPVRLSSQRLTALSDGEGADWRIFTSTRWASSANHLYEKQVTTAEAWTWLHQGAFRATPLDIKTEADTLMLQGINHFIAHGWPYSPPEAEKPGWAFYAAAVFNDTNPWWPVMADLNLYLQRMCALLRQGEPVADVAIFLPQDDALSASKPGNVTINGNLGSFVTRALTEQILDAGFSFDYVDAEGLSAPGFRHKVLVLARVDRIDLKTYERIEAFAKAGGVVIAVDRLPGNAAGLLHAQEDRETILAITGRLFGKGAVAETGLGAALKAAITPDVAGLSPQIGFVHRKLPNGDLYFIANTGNTAVTQTPRFRSGTAGQVWNPKDGTARAWSGEPIRLAPYESCVFVFGAAAKARVEAATRATAVSRRLTDGWAIAFEGQAARPLEQFVSWTDMPGMAHYSGAATYSCDIAVSQADIKAGLTRLNLGEGEAVPEPAGRRNGSQAWLGAPVRDAAEVFVNGRRAGSVWTAPFTIDLKGFLKAGSNRLEIRVANTAANLMAGQAPVDFSALTARYGERFKMQNVDNLSPQPSGLMRVPVLEAADAVQ